MSLGIDIRNVISRLEKCDFVSSVEIITADDIKERRVYKIRAFLTHLKYKLDIRFVQIKNNILYSYQKFSKDFYRKELKLWDYKTL